MRADKAAQHGGQQAACQGRAPAWQVGPGLK